MEFREDLMFAGLEVADRDELLRVLGQAVTSAGLAKDSYVQALQEREREYPTGLPISGGVAIPHTSAEYVHANTIVVATLATPVTFAEMGGADDSQVEVSTVFLLVLADAGQHVKMLSKLIRNLQREEFVRSIREADDASTMTGLLAEAFPA